MIWIRFEYSSKKEPMANLEEEGKPVGVESDDESDLRGGPDEGDDGGKYLWDGSWFDSEVGVEDEIELREVKEEVEVGEGEELDQARAYTGPIGVER